MIVIWKTCDPPMECVARWQGLSLRLAWDATKSEWRAWVDGRLVRQTWPSLPDAKRNIDASILRLITQAVREQKTAHELQVAHESQAACAREVLSA